MFFTCLRQARLPRELPAGGSIVAHPHGEPPERAIADRYKRRDPAKRLAVSAAKALGLATRKSCGQLTGDLGNAIASLGADDRFGPLCEPRFRAAPPQHRMPRPGGTTARSNRRDWRSANHRPAALHTDLPSRGQSVLSASEKYFIYCLPLSIKRGVYRAERKETGRRLKS
jgi:hypothetical protein